VVVRPLVKLKRAGLNKLGVKGTGLLQKCKGPKISRKSQKATMPLAAAREQGAKGKVGLKICGQ